MKGQRYELGITVNFNSNEINSTITTDHVGDVVQDLLEWYSNCTSMVVVISKSTPPAVEAETSPNIPHCNITKM